MKGEFDTRFQNKSVNKDNSDIEEGDKKENKVDISKLDVDIDEIKTKIK